MMPVRGRRAGPSLARRLLVLLVLGLLHDILLWPGAILIAYGLLGFVLLPFRDRRQGTLLTWALVLAAFVFYIPANVLPITHTTSLGAVQSDTIMSGVIYFIQSGSWPIALVIFVASVFVPLLKLFLLSFLLISVQRKSRWRPKDRTRLYRITEAVGRWSMTDIYVVTILVALVKLGSLATIEAGPGAIFFAGVVIITIFAAMSFDPRLIWDNLD